MCGKHSFQGDRYIFVYSISEKDFNYMMIQAGVSKATFKISYSTYAGNCL